MGKSTVDAPRAKAVKPATKTKAGQEACPTKAPPTPSRITLLVALGGGLILWAAFPPFDLPWLAWIAPLPWLWLVKLETLPGRRPYLALWLGGLAHWLLMLQGIRLAHPALYAG